MINRTALLIALVLMWLNGLFVFAETDQAKTLKFGAVLSLTGDAANNGEAIRKGITLATEELKEKGWTVEINFQDDATNPTKSVSSVQHLLASGHHIFVGPTWSFLIKAVKPLLEKSDAIAVVPSGSSDINGGSSNAILNLCPRRTGELSKVSEWLKSRSYKKAFILTPLGDWGVVHREVFQKAAQQAGIEISGDEQFDYGLDPTALKSILLRAKSRGADFLMTTASGNDLANMLKFRTTMQWNADMLTTEDLWDALDDGLISSASPILKNTWVVGLPLNIAFSKRFQARFNEAPKMYADRAYDAVMLLAKAAAATNGTAKEIRSFLSKGEPFVGVTGEIKFNISGDRMAEEYKIMEALNNKERA